MHTHGHSSLLSHLLNTRRQLLHNARIARRTDYQADTIALLRARIVVSYRQACTTSSEEVTVRAGALMIVLSTNALITHL